MKLYRYWASAEEPAKDASGKRIRLKKWAGSNDSLDAAKELAVQGLRALAKKVAELNIDKAKHYQYAQRDLPEEVIGDITPAGGITRNRAGCLVLNTTQMMIADIDLPYRPAWFARLFGKPEDKYLAMLDAFMQKNPQMGARVYRTAGGLRYLFTHAVIAPDDQAIGWLQEMGADPLYIRLCQYQNCYRARLTPKSFRLKMKVPAVTHPRDTATAQASFAAWLAEYDRKSQGVAVCRLMKTVGNAQIHDDLAMAVWDHDRAVKSESTLVLA